MIKKVVISAFLLSFLFMSFIDKPSVKLKESNVTYSDHGVELKGYIVYDENMKGKRPAVIVVHEWWGMNDYTKMRARMLASLGYVAMAVDIYGNGKNAADPKEAQELSTPFYKDPALAASRVEAAVLKIKSLPQTDDKRIGAIGYCFGGGILLNTVNMGSDIKAMVSFHGSLAGVPVNKQLLKTKILVCHGGDDKFVSNTDVQQFRHHMDSIHANYKFIVYPGATHAFTNPKSTETGKKFSMPIMYNEQADKKSWLDMENFFKQNL